MSTRDEYLAALRRAYDDGNIAAANDLADYIATNLPSVEEQRQAGWEAESPASQAAIGFGESAAELVQGISDIAPDWLPNLRVNGRSITDDSARADLAQSQEMESGYKTGGKIGFDVAALAVPATKAAKAANTVKGAIGAEAALAGLYEGLKAPEQDETRAGNAAIGAAATAAGGSMFPMARAAGMYGLNKSAPISQGAQALLDQGVKLTPGMARPNLAPVEKLMTRIPGLGARTRALQYEALQDWNAKILNQVTPGGPTGSGSDGFTIGQHAFSDAYDEVWAGVNPRTMNVKAVDNGLSTAMQRVNEVAPEYSGLANRALRDADGYWGAFKQTGDTNHLQHLDDVLRDAGQAADGPSGDYFMQLRQVFRQGLPQETSEQLTQVDKLYRDFATATRAGGYVDASQAGNVFTPRQLLGASKARSSARQTSTGQGSLQADAVDASNVMTPPLQRMNAAELEESGAPLMTAAALAVNPVQTALALGGINQAVTPGVRDALTGMAPHLSKSGVLTGGLGAYGGAVQGDYPNAQGAIAGIAADISTNANAVIQSLLDRMPITEEERRMEEQRRRSAAIRGF